MKSLSKVMMFCAPRAEAAAVTFVLTTNRLELLEPALAMRPGRIDQAVEVKLPDNACRRRLFELHLRDLPGLGDIDLAPLVAATDGVSAAIIGATRPEQVTENAGAAGVRLTPDLLSALDQTLGDLVATCSSPLSRNRTFGEKLGQGMSTEEIIASTRQVAEGAKSCASLYDLASNSGVDAPVADRALTRLEVDQLPFDHAHVVVRLRAHVLGTVRIDVQLLELDSRLTVDRVQAAHALAGPRSPCRT